MAVLDVMYHAFAKRGHTLNLAAGKSEAVVKLYGYQAPFAWQEHVAIDGSGVPCLTTPDGHRLRLVRQYKHLGTMLVPHSSTNADLAHRLSLAKQALHSLNQHLLRVSTVRDAEKLHFIRAFVVSRLLFGAESW
eukprot:14550195-Alexandrium_andersonii.AAC.1